MQNIDPIDLVAAQTTSFEQQFEWRVSRAADGNVALEAKSTYLEKSSFWNMGDLEGFMPSWHDVETSLAWKEPHSRHDSETKKSFRSNENDRRGLTLLSQIGERIGLRLDPQRGWRVLAPNNIVHFQFGVGVTAASDGSRVLLFERPFWNSVWMIAHRTNIVGPVTQTALEFDDWNYVTNKQVVKIGQRAEGTIKGTPKKPKLTSLEKALAVLNNALEKQKETK